MLLTHNTASDTFTLTGLDREEMALIVSAMLSHVAQNTYPPDAAEIPEDAMNQQFAADAMYEQLMDGLVAAGVITEEHPNL